MQVWPQIKLLTVSVVNNFIVKVRRYLEAIFPYFRPRIWKVVKIGSNQYLTQCMILPWSLGSYWEPTFLLFLFCIIKWGILCVAKIRIISHLSKQRYRSLTKGTSYFIQPSEMLIHKFKLWELLLWTKCRGIGIDGPLKLRYSAIFTHAQMPKWYANFWTGYLSTTEVHLQNLVAPALANTLK